jgi:Putative viral replication protein/RNA helicase
MSNAARNFCFTFNNYPDDLTAFESTLRELCNYFCFGKEKGASGTPHLQGYLQLEKKERLQGLVKKLPGCHRTVAKGGYDANYRYCSKDGEFTEYGTPSVVGKRKGLEDLCQQIVQGSKLSDLATQEPVVYARYHRGLEALSSAVCQQRNFKSEVFWFWGATGTGKSRRAFDLEPGAYWKPSSTKWWNGYDAHEAVIIDDYRRDFCTFGELLRLLDRYPFSVETKGGVRPFLAKRIYITSPKSPSDTWEGRTTEDLEQLNRRIENIVFFE